MTEPDSNAFRRLSRILFQIATLVFSLIVALMTLTLAGVAVRLNVLGPTRLLLLVLIGAPIAFYVWALWELRSLFASLAKHGLLFSAGAGAAVARTGWGLLLGGLVTLVAAPLVLMIVKSQSAGGFAIASLPAVTLCVVGIALIALRSVLRQGLIIQEERAALQATLDEFF